MGRAAAFEPRTDGIETSGDTGQDAVDAFGSQQFDFAGSNGASDSGSSGDFDPTIHVDRNKRNADGSYTRKRGRKSGGNSASRSQGKKVAPSVNAVETALVGIHAMAAAFLQTPELVLDDDESRPLATAVAEVAKHYDIPGLDAKAMAWVGLIMVSGRVYVPRFALINNRLKEEAKAKRLKATVLNLVPDAPKEEPTEMNLGAMPFDPLNPPKFM